MKILDRLFNKPAQEEKELLLVSENAAGLTDEDAQNIDQPEIADEPEKVNPVIIDYLAAGVNVTETDKISIEEKPKFLPKVLQNLGEVASMYDATVLKDFIHPALLTATGDIGTKLEALIQHQAYNVIGYDLVSKVANNIAVHGGKLILFSNHITTNKQTVFDGIVAGINEECKHIGCSAINDEPVETRGGNVDVAGFAVGVCEKDRMLPSALVRAGDYILGLKSNGIHTDGYSLIQSLIDDGKLSFNPAFLNRTKNYAKICNDLSHHNYVKAFVHITEGGFQNIRRVLPENTTYQLERWKMPQEFLDIKHAAGISDEAMYRTFNCGFGMLMIVDGINIDNLGQLGHEFKMIGRIV